MKTLCIINAPRDHAHAERMTRHLAMQIRNGLIKIVDDVATAEIVAVLLSADFILDERAWALSEEAKRRQRAGACRLIPIYVEPLAEPPEHLLTLMALPRHGKPVNGDGDWANIAGELRAIAQRESGVILPVLLGIIALSALVLVGAAAALAHNVIAVAVVGLLVAVGIVFFPLLNGLLAEPAPTVPQHLQQRIEDSQAVCAAPGGVPVEVRRLNAPVDPRARRTGSSGPHRRPERGHMLPATLALVAGLLFGGGAVVSKVPWIKSAIQAAHGHAGRPCGGGR